MRQIRERHMHYLLVLIILPLFGCDPQASQPTRNEKAIPKEVFRLDNDKIPIGTQAAGDVSVEHYRKEIEKRVSAYDSPADQARVASDVIRDLCSANRAADAWKLISQDFGAIRNQQLSVFFQEAKLPTAELITLMTTLEYEHEDRIALTYYLKRLSGSELTKTLLSDEFKSVQDELGFPSRDWLGMAVTGNLGYRGRDDAVASQWIENEAPQLLISGIIDVNQLSKILNNCGASDPFRSFDIISNSLETNQNWPEELPSFIEAMVLANPSKALDEMLARGSLLPSSSVSAALKAWLGINPLAAQQWYDSSRSKLNREQKDQAAETFSEAAMRHADLESATAWAMEINDEGLQAKTLLRLKEQVENP